MKNNIKMITASLLLLVTYVTADNAVISVKDALAKPHSEEMVKEVNTKVTPKALVKSDTQDMIKPKVVEGSKKEAKEAKREAKREKKAAKRKAKREAKSAKRKAKSEAKAAKRKAKREAKAAKRAAKREKREAKREGKSAKKQTKLSKNPPLAPVSDTKIELSEKAPTDKKVDINTIKPSAVK